MKRGTDVKDFIGEFDCSVATIGNFDGVHLGHRKIFERVKESACKKECHSLVITFEPHPLSVLFPARSISRITSPEKKLRLIEDCGIDGAMAIPFTLNLASKGPVSFVTEILLPLKICKLFVGHDFSFGSGRSGSVATLKAEGKAMGFEVFEIEEVTINGEPVRSTRIRKLITDGDMEKASALLGRNHSLSGTVIKGAGRGRALNFPTANLGEPTETVPSAGVYATKTEINGRQYGSATHVGVIPTFDVDIPGIETHIFDFNEDINGEFIEVEFIKKIRDTKKFDSIEELKENIRLDCEKARSIIKNEKE